jgi:hypothetical protein
MPQFAHYDHAKAAPSPVIGWYDTDALTYPNLPASSDLLEVTTEQWSAHMTNPSGWAVSNGALVSYTPSATTPTLAQQALAALNAMDAPGGCAIRCFKAGVAFPPDWQTYCSELRAIVNGTANPMPTILPTQPAYPAGT